MATIATVLLLSACSQSTKEKDPTVAVESALVKQKTIQHTISTEAILFPIHQAALVPKINAPVRKFYVNRGSHVRSGQLLAVLENRDLVAGAQQSQGEYEQAQASFVTTTVAGVPEEVQKAELDDHAAKQNLEAEQKVYESRQNLFKQGALPRKELDQAGVSLTTARNQYEIAHKHLQALLAVSKQQELKSAAGQLEAAKGKYFGAATQLSYSEIRSPIKGVITDRPLYPGEMVAAGTALLTVMDVSEVIAKAHIPQTDAALLSVGNPATITVPVTGEELKGRVTVVSPALDPNSTTVEIWIQAPNPKERLKPGTSVQTSVTTKAVPDALVMPNTALLTEPDGSTSVMVVGNDGRAHPHDVKTGISNGNDLQIVEGLKLGDRVITTGAYGLPDNTLVRLAQLDEQNPETAKGQKDEQDDKGGNKAKGVQGGKDKK